ncbi:M48 family metallopeptidase [Phaeovibrio sulfidiphilus]|uniref:M48 family metallopeptidase n=1 Tax=Phaeovibrio sulfidiphilus TaxID=1220600 RepID=A0A8J6YXS5_9PROT|nr:SprT family zinc-dependent metalloprotease [Phaeovibrio sulfidiphilus]MBE1237632.1 M48 family metallopeptidase [Phaeovibrio sulfidiphilus]
MGTPIDIDGHSLSLTIRRSRTARHLALRLSPSGDAVVVSAPPHVSDADLIAFARSKGDWVSRQLSRAPDRILFEPGARVPFSGRLYEIVPVAGGTRAVRLDPEHDRLLVAGRPEHVADQIRGWMRARARERLVDRVSLYCRTLGTSFNHLSLRDTRSRWGSCASSGRLSFSWRLIMAPAPVLDYVAAHEVAHLVEFNHSPRFWALVRDLVGDVQEAKAWLRTEGPGLHRIG